MKKIIFFITLAFVFSPAFALANFDTDVSYGMKGDAVLEVQEFLGTQKCFNGPYSGNFYSLTLSGVKCFQKAHSIPTTGYFGPRSRAAAEDVVASQIAPDETSTSTVDISASQSATPSIVFTLPNGSVISIAPNGTITELHAATASTSPAAAPITSVPNSTSSSMTDSSPAAAAPAEFVRTGTVAAVLAEKASTISLVPGRVVIARITFTNSTNETILFSNTGNENMHFAVTQNTIDGWTPRIDGIFQSQPLAGDNRGIKPNESGDVLFLLDTTPPAVGSFQASFTGFSVAGQTSGDLIDVSGFPFDLGVITVQ